MSKRKRRKFNTGKVLAFLEDIGLHWTQVEVENFQRLFIHYVNHDERVIKVYLDEIRRLMQ